MIALRWIVIALLVAPSLASAQGVVRVADYPSFGRVVFEFAGPTAFEVEEQGDRLLVVFEGAPALGTAPRLPRNVRAIQGGAGSATLVLAPGARFRSYRERNRVGIDVMDPVPGRGVRSPIRPSQKPEASTPAAATLPISAAASIPPAEPVLPAAMAEAPLAAPAVSVSQAPLSRIMPVVVTPSPARPTSILMPFEPGVGAAAFRRADTGLVVFDQPAQLDPEAFIAAQSLAGASVQLGQSSTVLAVPLTADRALSLLREPQGWRVSVTDDATPVPLIGAEAQPAGLLLKLDSPGQVVSMADPSTGLALLVGTANPTAGAGPATAFARRAPGYSLMPTWLGVVVEPLSDLIELHAVAAGFVLISPAVPANAEVTAPPSETFTHRFELPDLPTPALLQRLKAQIAAAAMAPSRARTGDRMAVARTLLSLGLATEAQAVLALVATEDPIAATTPDLVGLLGIAALLAGRSPEATGLDDPRLDGTDDVTLWRGVRDAMRDTDPGAGPNLARLLPLAGAYPAALRDRLRPLVIEAAVASGHAAAVAALLDKADDASLDFARALQRERDGDAAGALLAFDALAAGRDQLTQVRAGVRAAELRLRSGALTPSLAADALERYAAIWRGDARESRMRLRVAELRTAAGDFRSALETLRDTERLFPEQQAAVRAAMAAVFQAMLSKPQAVPALELITLASDYAGLLPNSGASISALLADKLLALDLPSRAGPMLATLMAAAPVGPARAGIGTRLAQMQIDDAAFRDAETALDASNAPELPEALNEQRALIRARARAGQGDLSSAVAVLVALGTESADDLRATLLSRAADWTGSLAALSDLTAKAVPADGPLSDPMQDIVLRQATSAVQANDTALLADLRRRYGTRLTGQRADLFHLLAAAPLHSPSDLPRMATELALARVLPDRLQGLAAGNLR